MELVDYKCYILSKKEKFIYGVVAVIIAYIFSLIFYDSCIPTVFCFFLLNPYYNYIKKILCKRRKDILCKQFMDAIISISASLESGCSIENSIWESYLQMSVVYSKNSYISRELNTIYNQLKLSIPIEEAFYNLSKRCDIEDINTFCEILKIAKRTDGNLVSIIRSTSATIREKYHIRREISTNINGKKYEQLIMTGMPIFIILYIKLTTPGFFDSIYHNLFGTCFVTVCLFFYVIAILLSIKITDIEV